ncbi:MAG: hypothetical protein JWQ14_2080 [Adhaeribacter sp.]|nr:hypothetical protein [Adhaeribacter sp.]
MRFEPKVPEYYLKNKSAAKTNLLRGCQNNYEAD